MKVNLVLRKKNGTQKSFPLPNSVTVIGRRQECDLCIPLMMVSRRHCQLNLDEGKLTIRDLGSRNGTFVNGERIEEAQIKAGDEIRLGPLEFTVMIDGKPAPEQKTAKLAPAKPAPAPQEKETANLADEFADLDDLDDLDNLINLDEMDSAIDTMRDSLGDLSQQAQDDDEIQI
ncbi:MAG: FHA domain-containing protein [Sedimentisphaerales bacterium]|nr:FHA domain-containing protein [Sedimentisphaerales bacterium]